MHSWGQWSSGRFGDNTFSPKTRACYPEQSAVVRGLSAGYINCGNVCSQIASKTVLPRKAVIVVEQMLDAAIAARIARIQTRRAALGDGKWKAGFSIPVSEAAHREGAGVYCLCDDCDDARVSARKKVTRP